MREKIKEHYSNYQNNMRNHRLKKETKERLKTEFYEWHNLMKKNAKKNGRKKTIKKNIKQKDLKYWTTITFKKEKASEWDYKHFNSLKRMLSRYNVDYVLIPENHKSGKYHLHGFINIPEWANRNELIIPKKINNKNIFDDYGNQVLELVPLEKNYGYTQLIDISIKTEREKRKMINYMIEYVMESDYNILSNRKEKDPYKIAVKMFGKELVRKEI